MAITKRKQADTYQIQIITGYRKDKNGVKKPIRHCEMFYGKKSEAKAREAKLKEQFKNGGFISNDKMTFNDLIDKWYNEVALPTLEIKTIEGYDSNLIDIRKELGHYRINELKPLHLLEFYNSLRKDKERNLSENTILHYYVLIGRILNLAVKWELLGRNVNNSIDRPNPEKKEAIYYDENDIKKLLDCVENECLKYKTIIWLAIDTGCRRGEMTGLTWDDIDFNNGRVTINKTTQATKNGVIEKEKPKNDSSIRCVPITPKTLQILKDYKEEQEQLKQLLGSEWENSNKVLITDTGGKMHPDTPSKIFNKIKKRYNLPPMKFHGLRHTSASILIASGVPMKAISKRLGHANALTTDTIYAHVSSKLEREAVDKMTEFLYEKATS